MSSPAARLSGTARSMEKLNNGVDQHLAAHVSIIFLITIANISRFRGCRTLSNKKGVSFLTFNYISALSFEKNDNIYVCVCVGGGGDPPLVKPTPTASCICPNAHTTLVIHNIFSQFSRNEMSVYAKCS